MFTKFNCVYCLTQQKTNTHYNQYSLFQAAWALFYCLYSCDLWLWTLRRSRPAVFCKRGVLWNYTKFTRKHLCRSFVSIKSQVLLVYISNCIHGSITIRVYFYIYLIFWIAKKSLRTCNFIKKRLHHGFFLVNFSKFLRKPVEHLQTASSNSVSLYIKIISEMVQT